MSPEQNSPFMCIGNCPAAPLCDGEVSSNPAQHFVLCGQQNSAVLKPHQWPIKQSHECATYPLSTTMCLFFLLCLFVSSAAYFHYPFTLTFFNTRAFYDASSGRLCRELAGCLVDYSSIGEAAEVHGTN